jgi:hypothetical protein
VTAAAVAVYAVALVALSVAVWRRPIVALYAFVLGLPLHNLVMSLLYGGGLRGGALDAIQAWKEVLLAVAVVRVVTAAWQRRRLPFQPGIVDLLAVAFAAIVLLYAVVPQSALGGSAGPKAILYGIRHDLVPVVAYFLGRSLALDARRLRSLAWTMLGAAAAVAAWGLIDEYAIPIEWWHHSGAVGYFHRELGFQYHGPGGLPENFAFNTSTGLFRRLVSVFVSPLATGYMLVVALLAGVALGMLRHRRLAVALTVVAFAGLLFTFSRSSIVVLAGGLVVLAIAGRRWWPLPAAVVVAAVGLGFAAAYSSVAPRTHWFASDLPYQQAVAKQKGPLPKGSGLQQTASLGEPSIRSHVTNLREGLRTVVHHPQGYGLGNAGATAARFGVPLRAGESNYTEIGVETGIAGLVLFALWNGALLASLVRRAWSATDETLLWAAAGVAAALAAILAVALQTDAYGVPWLGYCLWWLCGSLVTRPEVGSWAGNGAWRGDRASVESEKGLALSEQF